MGISLINRGFRCAWVFGVEEEGVWGWVGAAKLIQVIQFLQ